MHSLLEAGLAAAPAGIATPPIMEAAVEAVAEMNPAEPPLARAAVASCASGCTRKRNNKLKGE